MKKAKAFMAEVQIYYTDQDGTARIHYRRGPYKTNARDTETARPAYLKSVYKHTPAHIIDGKKSMSVCILDPCDPCDRFILEHAGEETRRTLEYCDELNRAAGRTIPRASFLPPASA